MAKGIDNKLDTAWSLLVKLVHGMKCEYCGKTTTLNSHHIYSRSKKSTRWSVENGSCLCVSHHTFNSGFSAHKTPLEFTEFIIEKRGQEWYENLRAEANEVRKWFKFEKEELLQILIGRIECFELDEKHTEILRKLKV